MADWLNLAGGAAKGFTQGAEDWRKSDEAAMRKEEFKSLQKQRKRIEEEQAKDDALEAEQKKVRVAGKYTDAAPRAGTAEAQPGFVGPPSGTKEVTVTPGQEARERAGVAGRSGRTKDLQLQSSYTTQALALDQAARVEKLEQAKSVLAEAGRLRAAGNFVGAAKLLQTEYAKLPDGHDIVLEDVHGVPHIGVAAGGKFTQPLQPLTAESVDAMIAAGHNMLNSENFYKGQEMGIKREELGVHQEANRIARMNADSTYRRVMFETNDQAEAVRQAEIQYRKDLGAAALMKARADVSTAGKLGPTKEAYDAQGNLVILSQVRGPDGKVSWQQDTMPEGIRLRGQPVPWDEEQKFYAGKLAEHEANETGPYKKTKDGKVNQDAIDKWKRDHRLADRPGTGGAGGMTGQIAAAEQARLKAAGNAGPRSAPPGASPSTLGIFQGNYGAPPPPVQAVPVAPAAAPPAAAPAAPPLRMGGGSAAYTPEAQAAKAKQAQYEADAKWMTPLQLAQKYDPARAANAAALQR